MELFLKCSLNISVNRVHLASFQHAVCTLALEQLLQSCTQELEQMQHCSIKLIKENFQFLRSMCIRYIINIREHKNV